MRSAKRSSHAIIAAATGRINQCHASTAAVASSTLARHDLFSRPSHSFASHLLWPLPYHSWSIIARVRDRHRHAITSDINVTSTNAYAVAHRATTSSSMSSTRLNINFAAVYIILVRRPTCNTCQLQSRQHNNLQRHHCTPNRRPWYLSASKNNNHATIGMSFDIVKLPCHSAATNRASSRRSNRSSVRVRPREVAN